MTTTLTRARPGPFSGHDRESGRLLPAPTDGRSLRVLVADGDPAACQVLRNLLPGLGHEVYAAGSGPQLAELCRQFHPDVVVTAGNLGGSDAVAAVREACGDRPVPVILVTDGEPAADGLDESVLAFVVKPVTAAHLRATLPVVVRQFEQAQALRRQVAELRQQLEDRKLVERAKGVVVRRVGLDEAAAFSRMRKLASDRNLKLAEVARSILAAEEVFGHLDERGESTCGTSKSPNGRARP